MDRLKRANLPSRSSRWGALKFRLGLALFLAGSALLLAQLLEWLVA